MVRCMSLHLNSESVAQTKVGRQVALEGCDAAI